MHTHNKTPEQIAAYLRDIAKAIFANEIDRKMIVGVLEGTSVASEIARMSYSIDKTSGISAIDFRTWYEDGVGIGDIVKWMDANGVWIFGMVGHGKVDEGVDGVDDIVESSGRPQISPIIVAKVLNGHFIICKEDMRNLPYLRASDDEKALFLDKMAEEGWYVNERRGGLVKFEMPSPNDLVTFVNLEDKSLRGAGIVRRVEGDELDFFCYMIYNPEGPRRPLKKLEWHYPPKETFSRRQWRFRKTEREAVSQEDSEDIEGVDNSTPATTGRAVMMKLNRELEAHGMVWNGLQKRVEPLERFRTDYLKAGEEYWYIDDMMKLKKATYNPTNLHRGRVVAGNAWKVKKDAIESFEGWREVLRTILAR